MHPNPTLLRTLALLCLTTLCLQAQAAGRRVALVVGNGNYTAISNLGNNPRNDADDMARALEGFGFSVTKLKDATRRDLNTALETFGRSASGSEAALFYFAGHGLQIRGDNFLMPVNATVESEAAVRDEGVSLSRVLDEMEGSAAVKIVLIDACRDNPITGKFRTAQRGLAPPAAPPSGTVIAFAAEPGKTAANTGGNGRNGVFTAGLLTAFKGKDLSLDGVLTVASEEVETNTRRAQTPYVNGPKTVQKRFHFRVQVDPGMAATEAQFWDSIKTSDDVADFEEYKRQYPQGRFVGLAENRIRRLKPATPVVVSTPPVPAPTQPVRPATASADHVQKDCTDCPEMVAIPAGSFLRADGKSVSLAAFAMAQTETTTSQYMACVVDKVCKPPEWAELTSQYNLKTGSNELYRGFTADTQPVVGVSWDNARDFAAWVSRKTGQHYQLPTEAQWEYAARAGTTTDWSYGNNEADLKDYAWYKDNSGSKTHTVKSLKPNPWNLHDMHGNVWEWVQDCYVDNYSAAPTDGRAVGQDNDRTCSRVLRGGGWYDGPSYLRSANRLWDTPGNSNGNFGFRLARTAP